MILERVHKEFHLCRKFKNPFHARKVVQNHFLGEYVKMFTILYGVVGHGVDWGLKVERRIEKGNVFC